MGIFSLDLLLLYLGFYENQISSSSQSLSLRRNLPGEFSVDKAIDTMKTKEANKPLPELQCYYQMMMTTTLNLKPPQKFIQVENISNPSTYTHSILSTTIQINIK